MNVKGNKKFDALTSDLYISQLSYVDTWLEVTKTRSLKYYFFKSSCISIKDKDFPFPVEHCAYLHLFS